jgi:glycosyltransferase involved in cell wall biosynthesis
MTNELAAPTERQHETTDLELSIVMPCLNEAETLGICIRKALLFLSQNNIAGEVVIADNGSSDGSQEIARREGARVIPVDEKGYGSALRGGIAAARGSHIIMGDADDSYDFSALLSFVEKLREGFELVMGNRFLGGIEPGAMPPLHRYLGNPVLTGVGRLFFRSPIGDFHCGLRAFSKKAFVAMDLRTTGMEFASEMVVKATLLQMKIAEVPTTLKRDGRSRAPHLRTWRDGWRHLRFLLLYSPRWLFLYPGAALMLIGLAGMLWLLPKPRIIFGVGFDAQTMIYAGMAVLLGFQAVVFAIFTKVLGMNEGLLPHDPRIATGLRYVRLETGLAVGFVLVLFGLGGSVLAVGLWGRESFGMLEPSQSLRLIVPAVVSLTLGCQIVLSSFFLSVLMIQRR